MSCTDRLGSATEHDRTQLPIDNPTSSSLDHPFCFSHLTPNQDVLALATDDLVNNAAETMLTRSPQVPARSPSASPSSFHTTRASSFHYAPASPQKRSPIPPTAVSRRQSTSSPLGVISSSNNKLLPSSTSSSPTTHQSAAPPPLPRSQQTLCGSSSTTYVAVDAATQYSPMEPHDYFAPPVATTKLTLPTDTSLPNLTARSHHASSQVHRSSSQPELLNDVPDVNSGTANDATTAPSPTLVGQPPMLKALPPQSPNKRRNSQGPGAIMEEASGSSSAQSLPKRVKPETAPPKVLPVRYELCAIEDIVVLIADMLSELIETNDSLAMRSGSLTRFHSR